MGGRPHSPPVSSILAPLHSPKQPRAISNRVRKDLHGRDLKAASVVSLVIETTSLQQGSRRCCWKRGPPPTEPAPLYLCTQNLPRSRPPHRGDDSSLCWRDSAIGRSVGSHRFDSARGPINEGHHPPRPIVELGTVLGYGCFRMCGSLGRGFVVLSAFFTIDLRRLCRVPPALTTLARCAPIGCCIFESWPEKLKGCWHDPFRQRGQEQCVALCGLRGTGRHAIGSRGNPEP